MAMFPLAFDLSRPRARKRFRLDTGLLNASYDSAFRWTFLNDHFYQRV